ncbi:MAG: SDR family oxidoreductase [Deltaproteobacteria bacterium]|nr:SDR family oxidoreductase [Deltaproteobacteria bacterium]
MPASATAAAAATRTATATATLTATATVDRSDLLRCLEILGAICEDRSLLSLLGTEERQALLVAAGRAVRPDRSEVRRLAKALRRREKRARKDADEARLDRAGIRALRREAQFSTPPPRELPAPDAGPRPELHEPRACYICKASFTKVHRFYDAMCERCGDFNWEKRSQSVSLEGRVALVTGARVKIGYQAAIKLLRAGARVIVTTRFPRDAAARYATEPDFAAWSDRLTVYGLDLRHTPSVEQLAQHLVGTRPRLDFLINNACQTVRRPAGFYRHLIAAESTPLSELPAISRRLVEDDERLRASGLVRAGAAPHRGAALSAAAFSAAALSQVALLPEDLSSDAGIFPEGRLDADLQQLDLRTVNSWRLRLAEVPTVELLEVQLVNAVAPFVLNARLKPLMLNVASRDKHIVNVSAMEGQFYRSFKTDKHPHTNMAKAALNMLTRTSAADYARDGIFMNSVDTGWVTDEDPAVIAEKKGMEQGAPFQPPLDIIDGAARILAPIFDGLRTGEHAFGQFFKDYAPVPW